MKDLLGKKWFILALLAALFVAVGAGLALAGTITGDALLKFWGGPVIATLIGYIFGRSEVGK